MHRNVRGLATIINQSGKAWWYSLLILFNVFMKLTYVTDGNLLTTKSDFTILEMASSKSDINLELNKWSDLLRKVSNWYPHIAMGNLVVNEFTAGIMKYVEKNKQLSHNVINANGGMTILVPV